MISAFKLFCLNVLALAYARMAWDVEARIGLFKVKDSRLFTVDD